MAGFLKGRVGTGNPEDGPFDIRVFVEKKQQPFHLEIKNTTTVAELQRMIEEKTEMPPAEQRILLGVGTANSREVPDYKGNVGDLGLKAGETIKVFGKHVG